MEERFPLTYQPTELVEHLRLRLREKQERNRRYSLRAFARDLGISHSHLSRVLRKQKRLSAAQAEAITASWAIPQASSSKRLVPEEWKIIRVLEHLKETIGATTVDLAKQISADTGEVLVILREVSQRRWVIRRGRRWMLEAGASQEVGLAIESFHRQSLTEATTITAFHLAIDPERIEEWKHAFLRFQASSLGKFQSVSKSQTIRVSFDFKTEP